MGCLVKALPSQRVRSVVAGSKNSLAICDDGKLFTWGWNQRGTLGRPLETKTENIPSQVKALSHVKIVQAAIGGWDCLAVDDDGRAYAWDASKKPRSKKWEGDIKSRPANKLERFVLFASKYMVRAHNVASVPLISMPCVHQGLVIEWRAYRSKDCCVNQW